MSSTDHNLSVSRTAAAAGLAITLLAGVGPAAMAQEIAAVRIATGLSRPLYVTAPPGDTSRLFIVEQRGSGGVSNRGDIRILNLATGAINPTPFLSVTGLTTASEQGLLGLAFAPDYATSGRFYVHYTGIGPTTFVVRYQVSANPDIADPASAEVLLTVPQPFSNHNGGWIDFGPDGYLYIALGDGGSANDPQGNGQNLSTLLGKMLRIDVSGTGPTYAIPPTNPFAGGGGRPEIWAYGLRNPWRGSFDRLSGDLWIADVGQGDWEEVNFQPAIGAPPYPAINYGWRCYEGNAPFNLAGCAAPSTMQFPVHVYPIRNLPECAVTGGYVYRGSALPAEQGNYFFADYCSAKIWSFRLVGGQVTDFRNRTAELQPKDAPPFIGPISSFGEDGNGELYIVQLMASLAGPANSGSILKIVPGCYANCDDSTTAPILNVEDFSCFINRFAQGSTLAHNQQLIHYANCDRSTTAPVLNVEDFSCFINRFAAGCQ
jgi:glucose/arabinose dehydrogenase